MGSAHLMRSYIVTGVREALALAVPYPLPYISMRTSPIIVGVVEYQMFNRVCQHPAHPRFLRR